MNFSFLAPLWPTLRVWAFGAAVHFAAKAGLSPEAAAVASNGLLDSLAGLATVAYGIWAGLREAKKLKA